MSIKKSEKVVIIGGGLAGMIAGCYLQKYGQQTIVLEQNHHTGGNMSGFRRGRYSFDGGDQSFESLGVVFPILQDLGIYNKIKWKKVLYRFASRDFDFFIDSFHTVESTLLEAFPDEPGIREIFKEVRRVSAFLNKHCYSHSFPLLNDFSLSKIFSLLPSLPSLSKWLTFEYREKVCSVIKNPALRNWFTGIGYYRMPFLFFAGFWDVWMRDYWYPEGGMQNFHNVIADRYKEMGGELRCNKTAVKIEVKNGKATGVRLHNGDFITADRVVYAGDYKNLLTGIMDESLFPKKQLKTLTEAKLTESLFTVFLGVKIPPDKLKKTIRANHAFWFPNYDVIFPEAGSPEDIHSRMWVTANFFMDESPQFAPPGESTLVLQTYSSMDWNDTWGNKGEAYPRSRKYQALKKKVGMELVELTENLVPGLSKKITFFDAGTPLTIKRFSMNTIGSSGGWCYDDKISPVFRSPFKNLMSTPVSNVHAAGHYTVWPGGVISAALSGRLVANLATGRPLLSPLGK
jgi:phytoene dehydrogenase-like protein